MKRLLKLLAISLFIIIITPSKIAQSSQQFPELCRQLKLKTDEIKHLKFQLAKVEDQYGDLKVVTATLEYYRRAGTLQKWNWLNKEYLLRVWGYCEKWAYLAGEDNSNIDMPKFMMGVCHNESNFSHFPFMHHNADGSDDFGITQINSKCLALAKLLPAILYSRDVKTDVEANIALRYLWIKDRKRMGMTWALMKPATGWALYAELKKVK